MNNYDPKQALNQQIQDHNIPNTEPIDVANEYKQSDTLPDCEPLHSFAWVSVYKSGLFTIVKSKDEKDSGTYKRIGNYIMPIGKTQFNGVSCLLLEFVNNSGVRTDIMIERGELADCRGLARKLLNAGYDMDIYYSKQLQGYLNQYQPESDIIATTQIGWVDGSYVFPDRIIGDNKNIRYYGSIGDGKFKESGTLEQWRENVAAHCVGYELLELGLYAGFASLLMPYVDFGFGLHFHGDSSKGKTTILRVASSIFGQPKKYINKWNATHNGMEFIGYNANHALCALDEVNEAAKNTLDSIYMLIDGRGKARAISRTGGVEQAKPRTWQTVALSTGEVSIEDLALQYGKNLKAGESVRMIDIEVNQICKDQAHANLLIEQTAKHHGTACIAFIKYLQANKTIDIVQMYKHYYQELITPHNELHSQASRVAKYFALLRVAGVVAIQAGILPNSCKPEYYTANLFAAWHKRNSMNKETKLIIDRLIMAVDDRANWFSDNRLDYEVRIPNKIGVHDGFDYYLISTLTASKLYTCRNFNKHRDVLVRAEIIPATRASIRDKATTSPQKAYKVNTSKLDAYREDKD